MASLKIKNTTSYSRTGVVTMGVPFSRAFNLQTSDVLSVANAATGYSTQKVQWYPVGARWDTGAVKYARVSFRTDLASQEEKTVALTRNASATEIPYAVSPALATAFASTIIQFSINGYTYSVPMINVALSPIEGGGSSDHYTRYRYFTHLPDNPLIPEQKYIWVELVAESYKDLNHILFYFRFGYYRLYTELSNSQGVNPRLNLTSDVTLRISGPYTKIRWEDQKIPSVTTTTATDKTYVLINPFITGKNRLVAGISHAYKGVFCYDLSDTSQAELEEQILGMAEDWRDTYPITGVMPANPSYITSSSDALNRSNTLLNYFRSPMLNIRDPYNWPTICNNPNTGDAGTHGLRDYAYGIRGWPILSTTNYNWIPFLEFCTRQQAVKNNWFYNTDGTPVTPTQFRSAGIRIWNGTYWFSNNNEKFCGFLQTFTGNGTLFPSSDTPTAAPLGQNIYGPDKEHFTNKMFILQGFITMDWFSLEYAKMYANYWIHANRTDNYGGYPSSIDTFGTARAAGRVSEVGAFLYEFTGNSELKTWIQTRLTFNLNQSFTSLVNKTTNPGGLEVIRAISRQDPCGQAACLNNQTHWRPWEEAQASLGFYLLAKAILTEEPSNTYGLRMLEISRDIAGSVLMYGYADGRSTSNRRFISLAFNTPGEMTAFKNAIGNPNNNIVGTGLTSGATGTIYLYFTDYDFGGIANIRLKVYMKNASGSFTSGEVFRLSTGATATIARIWPFAGGMKSRAVTSPTNGYARNLTTAEEEQLANPNEDPNYSVASGFEYGYLKYNYHYYLYEIVQIQTAVIAREAAALNHYGASSSQVTDRANDYINYHNSESGYNSDNGDYNESFLCFAGYLVPNLIDSDVVANVSTTTMTMSPLTVTTTITNYAVDVSAYPDSTYVTHTTSVPLVNLLNGTSVTVTPRAMDVSASAPTSTAAGSAISNVNYYGNTTIEVPLVTSVLTSSVAITRIVNRYLKIGVEVEISTQAPVAEVLQEEYPTIPAGILDE